MHRRQPSNPRSAPPTIYPPRLYNKSHPADDPDQMRPNSISRRMNKECYTNTSNNDVIKMFLKSISTFPTITCYLVTNLFCCIFSLLKHVQRFRTFLYKALYKLSIIIIIIIIIPERAN